MKYDAAAIETAAKETVAEMTKKNAGDLPKIARSQLDAMTPGSAQTAMKDVSAGKAQLVD